MCFMFSIAVCVSEDGSVIDEIINAYIVMQTILYINSRFLWGDGKGVPFGYYPNT